MKTSYYEFTKQDIELSANAAMSSILETMERENLLTEEQLTNFKNTHAIVVFEKDYINKWLDKLLFKDDNSDNICYKCVKIL